MDGGADKGGGRGNKRSTVGFLWYVRMWEECRVHYTLQQHTCSTKSIHFIG